MKLVWATHEHDFGCCSVGVQAAIKKGFNPSDIVVGVSSDFHRGEEYFAPLGVSVVASKYTRRDLFSDLVARLRLVCGVSDEWVISLDSDTILMDLKPFQTAIESGFKAAAPAGAKENRFLGCSTLFHIPSTRQVIARLLNDNPAKLPSSNSPDDIATALTFEAVFGKDSILRFPSSVIGWHRFDGEGFKEMQGKAIANFGQRSEARRLAKGKPVRSVVAEAMASFAAIRVLPSYGVLPDCLRWI